MKRRAISARGTVSVALALVVALAGAALGRTAMAQADAGKNLPAVAVVTVERKELTPVMTFTGRVEAAERVELRARVEGYLEQQLFTEGAEVKKGDLLFVIEKAPYQAQLAQVEASIVAVEAELKLAKLELDRKAELLRKQVVAQAQVDDVRAKHDEASAAVLRQKAAAMQAKLNLGYTEVYAPFAGQIGRTAYSVGNFVGPSSGTLATLVSREPIYASFPVSQREILALRRKGAETGADASSIKVRLVLADGAVYGELGAINFVDVSVSQQTDTVMARAGFPNPQRMLIDGQLVTVRVELAMGESALFIPQQGLQIDQGGYFVLVVDPENRVKVRRITIGEGRENEVTVTSGLEEGERVITDGVQKVRPDQVVQIADGRGAGVPR
jgi:membrane fusion protein, multidrug efflux system